MRVIGIGYAESTNGETFTRKSATHLGVNSEASDGGLLVAPRKWSEPNGEYENPPKPKQRGSF